MPRYRDTLPAELAGPLENVLEWTVMLDHIEVTSRYLFERCSEVSGDAECLEKYLRHDDGRTDVQRYTAPDPQLLDPRREYPEIPRGELPPGRPVIARMLHQYIRPYRDMYGCRDSQSVRLGKQAEGEIRSILLPYMGANRLTESESVGDALADRPIHALRCLP